MHQQSHEEAELRIAIPEVSERTDGVILGERTMEETQHKDLAAIAATDLDGITINRTKSKLDPFIEIRKERLVDQLTGAPSRSFGVWVPDPDRPKGWRDMGTVSEQYLLMTNQEVRQLDLEIARDSGLAFKETRIFWDGARFAHIIDFTDLTDEVTDGETVGLSLITRTSYDRSWKFEAALMGKRFACDNGLLSGEFFARIAFKHTHGSSVQETWQDIVRQGLSVIAHSGENLSAFVRGLRLLQGQAMNDSHLREIWKRMPGIGDSIMGKVMSRYVCHEEPTLYGFLNAGTHVFWHNKALKRADFTHNDVFVSTLLRYALAFQN